MSDKRLEAKIPFIKSSSDIPIVAFRVGYRKFYGILDTGSELTVVGNELYAFLNDCESTEPKEIELVSLGGDIKLQNNSKSGDFVFLDSDVPVCTVSIDISGSIDLKRVLNVVNDLDGNGINIQAVFGSDILKKLNAKIDYETMTLS